jgi:hypothetical protein
MNEVALNTAVNNSSETSNTCWSTTEQRQCAVDNPIFNRCAPDQPARKLGVDLTYFAGPVSSDQLMPHEVMTKGYGVDDG